MDLAYLKAELTKLLPVDCAVTEIIHDNTVTVKFSIGDKPFKAWAIHDNNEHSNEEKAFVTCYDILLWMVTESIEDPEGKRAQLREAIQKAWIKNITDGVGDARGEFVPSVKQVIDQL